MKLRGPDGETVEVVEFVDKMQTRRQVYRLKRGGGVHVGDFRSTAELAKHVDLASLVEDDPGQAATPPAGA